MRTPIALLLFSLAAIAGEHDGGSAAERRWTHPRGPASRSCVSRARAPGSLGPTAWTYKSDSPITAVPLTWDGTAYVRCGSKLLAIDTETGRRVASGTIADGGDAAVDAGAYYVRMGNRIVQWRRRGDTFTRRWSAEVGADASAPCVHDGELYLTAGGQLLRLRPGRETPAWKVGSGAYGAPALYGEEVYALEGSAVVARSRLDGKEVARLDLGAKAPDGLVAVNLKHVCARIGDKWWIARREVADGKLALSRPWSVPYTQEPLVYQNSTIGFAEQERQKRRPPIIGKEAFEKEAARRKAEKENPGSTEKPPDPGKVMSRTFMLFRWLEEEQKVGKGDEAKTETRIRKDDRNLVWREDRPDLLEGAGWPIALDDWFCTGLWCGNLNANELVWHLQERPGSPVLEGGVGFRPVPADDERLLIVSQDGRKLLCLQPEVIGK